MQNDELGQLDRKSTKWVLKHPSCCEVTVCKCEACGMFYMPNLGHVCDKIPRLEFSRWISNIEVHACPPRLVAMYDGEPNDTIDVSMWNEDADGKRWRFSIAYFKRDKDGYSLRFVGARPFLYVDDSRVPELWEALREAQKVLDAWFDDAEVDE